MRRSNDTNALTNYGKWDELFRFNGFEPPSEPALQILDSDLELTLQSLMEEIEREILTGPQ